MFFRLCFLVLAVFLFTGCEIMYQPKLYSQGLGHSSEPALCTEKPANVNSNSEDEKVWIEAKTNKMWVAPHVDESGDLVEGHYKYVIITPGHWAIKEELEEKTN